MGVNIFVDPVIVATPPDETSRDEVVAWLKNLEIWLKEALGAHFLWLHARNITVQLEAYGRLPNFNTLRGWARQYGLDINPGLLARDINTFFRDPEHDLENKLADLGYTAEGNPVTIEPAEIITRWPEFIHGDMQNLLTTACICKHVREDFACNLHMVTLKLAKHAQEINILATIKGVIPESACQPGDTVAQAFPLLFTPEDLLPFIDVLALWHEGEAGMIYAIKQQFEKDWLTMDIVSLLFSFGSRFMQSITEAGLDTNEIVLKKIVKLAAVVIAGKIERLPGAKLHPLRTNLAADSPQRIRSKDQAKAWRLDVAKHGAGWRLHYWHIPGPDGESIEFSNICKESESHIFEQ